MRRCRPDRQTLRTAARAPKHLARQCLAEDARRRVLRPDEDRRFRRPEPRSQGPGRRARALPSTEPSVAAGLTADVRRAGSARSRDGRITRTGRRIRLQYDQETDTVSPAGESGAQSQAAVRWRAAARLAAPGTARRTAPRARRREPRSRPRRPGSPRCTARRRRSTAGSRCRDRADVRVRDAGEHALVEAPHVSTASANSIRSASSAGRRRGSSRRARCAAPATGRVRRCRPRSRRSRRRALRPLRPNSSTIRVQHRVAGVRDVGVARRLDGASSPRIFRGRVSVSSSISCSTGAG